MSATPAASLPVTFEPNMTYGVGAFACAHLPKKAEGVCGFCTA
jgi:hypothetical protein